MLDWFEKRVKAQMVLTGVKFEDLLGASDKSWRRRLKDPSGMRLYDLAYLVKRLGFTKEEKEYIVTLLLEDAEKEV